MANQDEELFYYVGEVRTSSGESKGKLLFEMIVADQGLSILLKPKGDKKTYLIPLYLLIESFVNKTKDERMKLYIRGIEKKTIMLSHVSCKTTGFMLNGYFTSIHSSGNRVFFYSRFTFNRINGY